MKLFFKKLGKNVMIDYKTFFRYMSGIKIGNNVNINRGCEFFTSAHLETVIDIKDNVTFSPNVKLYSAGHDYKYLNLPDTAGDIIIKEYVWIGGNSVVLQGVTIGEYSIVSANSVVTKDIKTQELVKKYNFKFTKSLGQNFLVDDSVLSDIVNGAEVNDEDFIIEIGPGVGTLTAQLLMKAKKVTAIELDSDLIPILEKELGDNENFNLIHKDKKTEQILEESFNRTTNIIDKEKNKWKKIKEQKF